MARQRVAVRGTVDFSGGSPELAQRRRGRQGLKLNSKDSEQGRGKGVGAQMASREAAFQGV